MDVKLPHNDICDDVVLQQIGETQANDLRLSPLNGARKKRFIAPVSALTSAGVLFGYDLSCFLVFLSWLRIFLGAMAVIAFPTSTPISEGTLPRSRKSKTRLERASVIGSFVAFEFR